MGQSGLFSLRIEYQGAFRGLCQRLTSLNPSWISHLKGFPADGSVVSSPSTALVSAGVVLHGDSSVRGSGRCWVPSRYWDGCVRQGGCLAASAQAVPATGPGAWKSRALGGRFLAPASLWDPNRGCKGSGEGMEGGCPSLMQGGDCATHLGGWSRCDGWEGGSVMCGLQLGSVLLSDETAALPVSVPAGWR